MKFLITGATGFVGRYLISHLLSKYNDIKIIGTFRTVVLDKYDERVELIRINLNNIHELIKIIQKFQPDYAIHLASESSVGFSWKEPSKSFYNNVNIFLNLLEAIRINGIKCRVLSVGSSEIYGSRGRPYSLLSENESPDPLSPYAVARVSQELLSKVYSGGFHSDIILTRSFNHIGPGQDERFVVSSFAKKIVQSKLTSSMEHITVGDLSIVRDFVDVRDVVVAYDMLLMHGQNGEIYNVCSSNGVTLNTILNKLMEIANYTIHHHQSPEFIRPNDNPVIIGSYNKLFKLCGWRPKINLETSLSNIIEYWTIKISEDSI
jgi:GDP-4-dehydro-6-deoxy-D-mannose reductase